MNDWIAHLTTHALLLYNLLFASPYLGVSGETNFYAQSINAQPVVESIASADSFFLDRRNEDFRRFYEAIKDTSKLDGLFTLYRREVDGKIYVEIKPEQLNQNYLATVTLESGIGESGIYSGLSLQDFLFYFRRVNNNLHLAIRNVKFRTEAGEPETRSLARSFSDSVLYSLKIVSINPHTKGILVNLDDLLLEDFPGLTSLLKYFLQADYRLDYNKSYFGEVQNFPLNLEIDSIYGFDSEEGANLVTLPDSRALSLKVHYSFSQLPESNGYTPRLADDRIGYFITAYQQFSTETRSEPFVRYINRWRLEPSDPDAPLSPPKQPIVFWLENAVPMAYRPAIREGVLMWNKAFEKAGFQNAIEVRQMPDNADWHPADVRYNTIRWFNSMDANFARGMSRVNPLTGEILDADIIVDSNMVRITQQEYRALMETNNPLCQNSLPVQESGVASRFQQLLESNHYCYGIESAKQAAMGAIALSLLPNGTPNNQLKKEYLNQYLRSLIAHEVGHVLGLRHNFHGSTMLAPSELNDTEITHSKGLVSSVMDYLPVNLAPPGIQQGDYFPAIVGPYDELAIKYGYKPNPDAIETLVPQPQKQEIEQTALELPQPEFSYATDEDIRDINPDANLWDLSSDVLVYSQWQMDNARLMLQRLEKDYPVKGNYGERRVLFDQILNYYLLNANLLMQYIGGQSFKRNYADEEFAFVPVTLEKQRHALTNLQDYVFAKEAFNFSPALLNQLAPSRWYHWGNPIPVLRLDYPIHSRILMFQSSVLRSLLDGPRLYRMLDIELKTPPGESLTIPELFETLQNSIWTEVLNNRELGQISSIRRSLQREHLNILLAMVLRNKNVPEDGRTLAWYQLRQLQKTLQISLKKQGENLDIYTKAHLEETCDRIAKALNAQLQSN
jgi:hypothetical protein